MEEYIEDILEDNDLTTEFLEVLDFDSDLTDGDWSDLMQNDRYFYNQ